MPIISISLNDRLTEEMDSLKRELGYSGRSEIIRAGVRNLIADNKEKQKLTGKTKAVMLLVHKEDAENAITELKHDFEDIISTHIHSRLKGEKCLEVFMLDGEASGIKSLLNKAQANRKIDYTKLIVP